jgi:hypothetical protein
MSVWVALRRSAIQPPASEGDRAEPEQHGDEGSWANWKVIRFVLASDLSSGRFHPIAEENVSIGLRGWRFVATYSIVAKDQTEAWPNQTHVTFVRFTAYLHDRNLKENVNESSFRSDRLIIVRPLFPNPFTIRCSQFISACSPFPTTLDQNQGCQIALHSPCAAFKLRTRRARQLGGSSPSCSR